MCLLLGYKLKGTKIDFFVIDSLETRMVQGTQYSINNSWIEQQTVSWIEPQSTFWHKAGIKILN